MPDNSWDDPDGEHSDGDLDFLGYLPDSDAEDENEGASDLDVFGGSDTAETTAGYDDTHEFEDRSGTEYFDAYLSPTLGTDSYSEAVEAHDTAPATEDQSPGPVLFAVAHPTRTITAQATIAGAIRRVTLTPQATSMSEAELARNIMVTAKLANMKGRAVQRALIEGILESQGLDHNEVEALVEMNAAGLPTPRQADAAVAEAEAAHLRGEY